MIFLRWCWDQQGDSGPTDDQLVLGDPGWGSCLTSLRSRLSSTVLSRWAQASRSGLQEWSSSWPLSWSVTSGTRTSRQSAEHSEEHGESPQELRQLPLLAGLAAVMWLSYLAGGKGCSPPFCTCSRPSGAPAACPGCSQWTWPGEHYQDTERGA